MSVPASPWLDRSAYPFRSHYASLSAGRVHYVDEGPHSDGSHAPILLVHGTPSWSFEYRHLIRTLSTSRRVVAFDHLGFGLSDRPDGFGYRPEDHARTFAEFVEALGLRRFTLVVHDFGGPIALPFAIEHPERVTRLVVLNSFMWPFEERRLVRQARLAGSALGRFMYRYLNFSLRVLMPFAYGDKRRLTPAVHAQYLAPFRERRARVQVLWALARSLLASTAHFDQLWRARENLASIPALVLWGSKDRVLPPHYVDRWRAALPQARVELLPNAGHWPHEEAAERTSAALHAFV